MKRFLSIRFCFFQISLAVAALAVQVPAEDWGDGGIMKWLRDEMNSYPDIVPSFLELLRVLPEVYANINSYSYEKFL